MKMNMPVMEIIKFDSNDVIATSGMHYSNCYQYVQGKIDGVNDSVNSCETMDPVSSDMLESFKSQIDFPESGAYYHYTNGVWTGCNCTDTSDHF